MQRYIYKIENFLFKFLKKNKNRKSIYVICGFCIKCIVNLNNILMIKFIKIIINYFYKIIARFVLFNFRPF
jgi:hypothetical protein